MGYDAPMDLLLNTDRRRDLWQQVAAILEDYLEQLPDLPVSPPLDPEAMRRRLAKFDFADPMAPDELVRFTAEQLSTGQVHVGHPGYFGLFNPAPSALGIAADTLVAGFNPQLAAWSHSPFAVEVERHLVRALGSRFGYPDDAVDGTFCAGGMEANHTSVLTALTHAFSDFARDGVRGLPGAPVLYVSAEAHDSFQKAARLTGLGHAAAVAIPTDAGLRMDTDALKEQIARDRSAGREPFMVVATMGTTSAGILDPADAIADIAASEGLWFHADAAWGGAVALVPELRELLRGVERSDSLTLDAHKWLSVPMGAGIYLTRRPGILEKTFRVGQSYMPSDARHLDIVDPYAASMQWSRRFTGLKLFMSLAAAGWDGYRDNIRRMSGLGDELRALLGERGWQVVCPTSLPVVCFVDEQHPRGQDADYLQAIASQVVSSGKAWISTPVIGNGRTVLRACISSHRTSSADMERLMDTLDEARRHAGTGANS